MAEKLNSVYSVEEAARLLFLRPRTVLDKIRAGELAAHQVGRRNLIWGDDIERFINRKGRRGCAGSVAQG